MEEKRIKEKKRECKYCGSEIKVKAGINNWKNLLRKPTLDEWITLFIITMVILSSYAYKNDISELNEFYTDESYCMRKLELDSDITWTDSQIENPFDSINLTFGDG